MHGIIPYRSGIGMITEVEVGCGILSCTEDRRNLTSMVTRRDILLQCGDRRDRIVGDFGWTDPSDRLVCRLCPLLPTARGRDSSLDPHGLLRTCPDPRGSL